MRPASSSVSGTSALGAFSFGRVATRAQGFATSAVRTASASAEESTA